MLIVVNSVPNLIKNSGVTYVVKHSNSTYFKNIKTYNILWSNDINNSHIFSDNFFVPQSKNFFFKSIQIFLYIKKLIEFKKNNRILFINHGLWHPIYTITSLSCIATKTRYLTILHGMLLPEALKIKKIKKVIAFYFYQKFIIDKSHKIITTSEFEKKKLYENFPCFKSKVTSITFGIDFEKNYSTKLNKKIISISRIHPIKNFEVFIDNWDKNIMSGWTWEIYGPKENNTYYEFLKQKIVKKKLSSSIFLYDQVQGKKKINLIKNSSFLLQPSKSENFNFSIAEALSKHKPIITTKQSSWVNFDKFNIGFFVDSNSKEIIDLYYTISNLRYSEYKKLVSNIKKIENKFSWKNYYKTIYKYHK